MIYDKPDMDYRNLKAAACLADADAKVGREINADAADLSAFKAAGGKLIQYHGWSDSAILPVSSIKYYTEAAAKLGGEKNVTPFYRLFMAPGMEHCGIGPGANAIGGVFGLPAPKRDPGHDVASERKWRAVSSDKP